MLPQVEVQTEISTLEYPEGDGLPIAETGFHVTLIAYFLAMLREFFRSRPDVYVGANMFLYYREGDPNKKVAPDLFVVLGASNEERRIWKVWEEGQAPAVVFEFTSRGTWDEDLGSKKGLYEWLGVQEYFLFDPLQEYLEPVLQGFRLVEDTYERIEAAVGPGGTRQLSSQVMGLWLRVEEDRLHLYEQATERKLLAPLELAEALRVAEARAQSAEVRVQEEAAARQAAEARAQSAEVRAQEEAAARQAAEAELARVRAELEWLRGHAQG